MINHDHCHKEIASLRKELDDAYGQIDYLKGLLTPTPVVYPASFHLTRAEASILDALRTAKGAVSLDRLALIVKRESVKIHISRLRRKLLPIHVDIGSTWGTGYYFSEEDKQKLNEAIRDQKALLTRKEVDETYKRGVGYVSAI